jgi:HEPN domain-containing protein
VCDLTCFHCQQCAEKYIKALLQEAGLKIPRIHELEDLLVLLVPGDSTLNVLQKSAAFLSGFAVDNRYPGTHVTRRKTKVAVRRASYLRREIRIRLGLEKR